jgi:hypothetical protein
VQIRYQVMHSKPKLVGKKKHCIQTYANPRSYATYMQTQHAPKASDASRL